jgi:hypothetical protein
LVRNVGGTSVLRCGGNADYEVHAEKDGAKSQTRQVSSFDNRKEIVLTLKLDKKKD